jgi:hypothetical protein
MVSEKRRLRRMRGERGGADDIVELRRKNDGLSEPSIVLNKNW